MALRTEDIPTVGVPLFHVTDFGRWDRVGRLRAIRYCCVICDYCNGFACVILRPDFVKATQRSRLYDPDLARRIDRHCHTCAVRVQWKNKSARVYLCYPQIDLIDCLEGVKKEFQAELIDFKRAPRHGTATSDCLCAFPKSYYHMFPTVTLTGKKKSGKVLARRYGDESRVPRPAASPTPVSNPRRPRKRKRLNQQQRRRHYPDDRRTVVVAAAVKPNVPVPVIATAEWKLNALKKILEAANGTPLLVTALPPTKMKG